MAGGFWIIVEKVNKAFVVGEVVTLRASLYL